MISLKKKDDDDIFIEHHSPIYTAVTTGEISFYSV